MGKGKLILICQSGGKFLTDDNGSMSYIGGEAEAVDMNPETTLNDLTLEISKLLGLDQSYLSLKYFLPGNKQTLITIKNEKDLKRMYDYHLSSVTAEVFVNGKKGFRPEAVNTPVNRKSNLQTITSTPLTSGNAVTIPLHVDTTTLLDNLVSIPVTSVQASPKPPSFPGTLVDIPVAITTDLVLPGKKFTPKKSKITTYTKRSSAKSLKSPPKRSKRTSELDSGSKSFSSVLKRSKRTANTDNSAAAHNSGPIHQGIVVCGLGSRRDMATAVARSNTSKKRKPTVNSVASPKTPKSSTIAAQDANFRETEKRMSLRKRVMKQNTYECEDEDEDEDEDDDDDDSDDDDPEVDDDIDDGDDDYILDDLDYKPDDYVELDLDSSEPDSNLNANDGSPESLVASWRCAITGVGQEFDNVNEFREELQKYAVARRFGYKLKKNESNRATGVCTVKGCSWKIHASWVPNSGVFRIKKFNKMHTCEGGESWKSAHPKKDWLVNIIKDKLKEDPNQKTRNIAKRILQDLGLELSYCRIRRGIDEARGELHGSFEEAYKHLPHLVNKIVEANPDSLAVLLIGDDRKFQRLFISFRAFINGFQNGCRPLLFLDATSLKSKYHEVLLTASALDADDNVVPVALGVVDVETDETWRWFLEQLKSAVRSLRTLTFVSDRVKGLMKFVSEIFEDAHHGYSIHYLMEDFMRNMKGPYNGDGKLSLPPNLLAAARADRPDGFKFFTEQIKRVSVPAYEWVMQSEPKHWSSSLFQGQPFCHITSDVGEIYSKWIKEIEDLPIVQKLEALVGKLVDLAKSRQDNSKEWSGTLVPSMEEKLREEWKKASILKVFIASDTIFEVHDGSVQVVDISKRSCSCFGWKPTGLPCRHAIAVLNSKGSNLYGYCSVYFSIESYRLTYSETIHLPSDVSELQNEKEGTEEELVLPPPFTRSMGLEKRMQDRKRGRSVCCRRCGGIGHNRATCKESMQ